MREIKFRAQDFTGTWQYGFLVKGNETAIIIPVNKNGSVSMGINFYVKPETVGQFTGLTDKNGNEIYEGDIFVRDSNMMASNSPYCVRYENGSWIGVGADSGWLTLIEGADEPYRDDLPYIEVIGNIHDNLELLKND